MQILCKNAFEEPWYEEFILNKRSSWPNTKWPVDLLGHMYRNSAVWYKLKVHFHLIMNGLHADQGDRHAILHTNAVYVLKLSVIEMFKHYCFFWYYFFAIKSLLFFFFTKLCYPSLFLDKLTFEALFVLDNQHLISVIIKRNYSFQHYSQYLICTTLKRNKDIAAYIIIKKNSI